MPRPRSILQFGFSLIFHHTTAFSFSQSSVNSGWCFFAPVLHFCGCFKPQPAWLSIRTSRVTWLAPPQLSWFHSTKHPFRHPPIPGWCAVSVESLPVLFWNAAIHFSWIYLQTLFCFTPCLHHTFVQSVSQVFQYLLLLPTYHFVSSHFTVNPIIYHFFLLLAALLFPKDLYLIKNATKGSNNTLMERWSLEAVVQSKQVNDKNVQLLWRLKYPQRPELFCNRL